MQIKLAKARKSDLKILARIYLDEFSKQEPAWTFKTAYARVSQGFARFPGMCFLIKAGKKTIGFVLAEVLYFSTGKFAYLADIAIKSEFQNLGFGTMALGKFCALAKKRGFKEVFLHTSQHGSAINFYKHAGFSESGYILLRRKLS